MFSETHGSGSAKWLFRIMLNRAIEICSSAIIVMMSQWRINARKLAYKKMRCIIWGLRDADDIRMERPRNVLAKN